MTGPPGGQDGQHRRRPPGWAQLDPNMKIHTGTYECREHTNMKVNTVHVEEKTTLMATYWTAQANQLARHRRQFHNTLHNSAAGAASQYTIHNIQYTSQYCWCLFTIHNTAGAGFTQMKPIIDRLSLIRVSLVRHLIRVFCSQILLLWKITFLGLISNSANIYSPSFEVDIEKDNVHVFHSHHY